MERSIVPAPRASNTVVRAGAIVVGVTLLANLPAVFHSFVEWDDVTFIAGNPRFNPASWNTVGYYWTHPGENLYMPFTYTLWAALARAGELNTADATGGRLNPYLFHLVSVLLHTGAALAVYLLLGRIVRSPWPAAAGALFFALHPLQVESIAFIGTMNTPLAAALGLWAVWFYLRSRESAGRTGLYLLATGVLLAAMLSKPTAVVLPLVALLLDLSGDRRHCNWRRSVIAILPWIGLSAACAVCARLIQPATVLPPSALWNHLLNAADSTFFYLHKLLIPCPLAIDYGQHVRGGQHAQVVAMMLVVVIAIDLAAAHFRPAYRHCLLLAVALAIIGLLPNSGLVSFDFQLFSNVADRYVYLAMLGPALLVAVAMGRTAKLARPVGLTAAGSCLLMLTGLAALSERQIQTWGDGTTLFHHAIAVNPNSWMSYANLANLEADSDPPQAMADCRKSLAINPGNASAWNTLGSLLMARGQRGPAIEAFENAHRLQPDVELFAVNAANARRANAE